MQKPKIFGARTRALFAVVAAVSLGLAMTANSAFADDVIVARATLVAAPAKASPVVVDGLTWTCVDTECTGVTSRGAAEQARFMRFDRGCKAAAAALGPLSSYTHRGRAAPSTLIVKCNAG